MVRATLVYHQDKLGVLVTKGGDVPGEDATEAAMKSVFASTFDNVSVGYIRREPEFSK